VKKRQAENPEIRTAKLARDNETRRLRKANDPTLKELHNKRARVYAEKYPEKIRALQVARKARVRSADGSFSGAEWLACLEKYCWQCPQCGVPLHDSGTVDDIDGKRKATVDHVVPLKHGGTNWIANIQPMCMTCNTSKQDHFIVLLAPWAGRPVEVFREDLATKGWVRDPAPGCPVEAGPSA
jgi:5-methylcytosine-specific restriction endonuclease McrA